MALVRWSPRSQQWDPFASLQEIRDEMNRILYPAARQGDTWENLFTPAIDVVEEKEGFVVKADLPGLTKDEVNVSIQDNYLTIRGERKHEVEKNEANYHHRERVYGTFTRTIELPATVDSTKVQANFRDGVLHVTLPKSESAKPKEIKVNVS